MKRRASISAVAVLACLAAEARPGHAAKVKSGAFDICRIIDGGQVDPSGRVCCARETRGDEQQGQGTGPGYCVECAEPGSDDCEIIYTAGSPSDQIHAILIRGLLAQNQGLLVEQQQIRASLGRVLAGVEGLQARMDEVQAACAPADLFPEPRTGSSPPDFCRTDETGSLVVRVKNQGPIAAPATSLRVTFGTPAGPVPVDLAIPAVGGAGGFADVATPVPAECLGQGSCSFQITVDADGTVFESSETNNSVSGVCTAGPAKAEEDPGPRER